MLNKALKEALFIVKVSRPVTWTVAFLLLLTGLYVAGAEPTLPVLLYFLLFTALFLFVVFGVNDVFDYRVDRISGRKRIIEGVVLPKPRHRTVLILSALSSIALAATALLTGKNTALAAALIGIASAYAYSAPPIRLKEKPILDSLSNIPFAIAFLLFGYSFGGEFHTFPAKLVYASFGAASIHSLGAIVDYPNDKKAGMKTIATFFGKRFASLFAGMMILTIILFSGIQNLFLNAFMWLSLLTFIAVFIFPSEKNARKAGYLLFAAFIAAMTFSLHQQFFKSA